MRILTIDASTKNSGYAIFEDTKLIKYNCISASSTDVIKRIKKMIQGFDLILTTEKIDKIILEEVRPEDFEQERKIQLKTYKALMYLQAAIVFLVHEKYNNIDIEFVYPSEWRAACGIHTGRGIKREMLKNKDISFVKDNYNLTVNDDEADAIAMGHAYINQLSNELNWE